MKPKPKDGPFPMPESCYVCRSYAAAELRRMKREGIKLKRVQVRSSVGITANNTVVFSYRKA